MNKRKIFGIGLGRTSTGSLTHSLRLLGLRSNHFISSAPASIMRSIHDGNFDFPGLRDVDAWVESPVNVFYAELDDLYPDSKFVLTVRDEQSWLASIEKRFSIPASYYTQQMRYLAFGTSSYNEIRMTRVFREHNNAVRRYFDGRENQLLEMNIAGGDGWNELCAFLEKPIPPEPFPSANQSAIEQRCRKSSLRRYRSRIKSVVQAMAFQWQVL